MQSGMSDRRERVLCGVTCWASALAVAGLAFVVLLLSGAWSLLQALWAAGVVLLGLGLGFRFLFCRPLPPPVGLARRAPATQAAAPAAPVAQAAPEIPAAPAPQPGPAPQATPKAPAAPATGRGESPGPGAAAPDDLKAIRGIGPKLEAALNAKGVVQLAQIAAWSPEEVAWWDENLEGFRGRVTRDGWVDQARRLVEGKDATRKV